MALSVTVSAEGDVQVDGDDKYDVIDFFHEHPVHSLVTIPEPEVSDADLLAIALSVLPVTNIRVTTLDEPELADWERELLDAYNEPEPYKVDLTKHVEPEVDVAGIYDGYYDDSYYPAFF